jgi:hypothetical protein
MFLRRQLAFGEALVRIDATRPVPEVVEHILHWLGF